MISKTIGNDQLVISQKNQQFFIFPLKQKFIFSFFKNNATLIAVFSLPPLSLSTLILIEILHTKQLYPPRNTD